MLSPSNQALDNIEGAYLYAFALPPAGGKDYSTYQCWPNLDIDKEVWVSPEYFSFPLPGWYVDLRMVHTSQLEDIEDIKRQFYSKKKINNDTTIILAIEWYNQSFLKYTLRNISGRLVDIATAFETLFQLPLSQKKEAFKKSIREYLSVKEGSVLDDWATDFYSKVRSETVHKGKPISFLFQHPEAKVPHLSFLWMAQRIFRECLAVKTGLPRHIDNNRLIDELTPNEVHLKKLKNARSFEKILKDD